MHLAGFTSTGSKRPDLLFGAGQSEGPLRMRRSEGCRLWDDEGREYLDFLMALGAVGLGYGHPAVTDAVVDAARRGAVGSLAPIEEELLAHELCQYLPMLEQVRFLKTGAEAVAAAVRLARVATGRDGIVGCGYHGWLDWCSANSGVPEAVRGLYQEIPFNDIERSITTIRAVGPTLAAVVLEPVIDAAPSPEWLRVVREETSRCGALLIFDEIKTAFRVGPGSAAQKWGGDPDLIVLGKALANGYPLAAVGGRAAVLAHLRETWISSTLATEFVSLAAARATLHEFRQRGVTIWLQEVGGRLLEGLGQIALRHADTIECAAGIPEMCHLRYRDAAVSERVARECAARGLLFKRTGYNFVSLSHRLADVDHALEILSDVLGAR